jgi:hypothetical protein
VDLLVEKAAKTDGVEAEAGGLRSHVGRLVKGCVRVEIGVAVETGDAEALVLDLAVLGLVELLLRERVSSNRNPSICTGEIKPTITS